MRLTERRRKLMPQVHIYWWFVMRKIQVVELVGQLMRSGFYV